jgi:riboflavin synthase
MFTGIVTALGEAAALEREAGLLRAAFDSPYDSASIDIGASISHGGCCLTVVAVEPHATGARHWVEMAAETLAKTTLGRLKLGDKVNLERALRAGDELGGHLVAGHVDTVGELLSVTEDGPGRRMLISAPPEIANLIAPKGSVVVDGVSLTTNEVEADRFGVMIIPHTLAVTTLGKLAPGDKVNLEADLIARYAARILAARS